MVPQFLFDISDIDLNQSVYDLPAIEEMNPHRGDMRMLDGIIWTSDPQEPPLLAVAYKDVGQDEFWVAGHIPGRPLFPGVLMIEAAAQLASAMRAIRHPGSGFMGFTGADDIKFRGQVVPGNRLILIAKELKLQKRRAICQVQGLVDGTMVFEAKITGMSI